MRTTIAILALGLASFTAAIKNDGSSIPPGTHTDPVEIGIILKDGDWRMHLAHDCLTSMFRTSGDSETAGMLRILDVTGFSLSKVVMKELKQDPNRIRFGFEFTKPEKLKTVYWEADCPMELPDDQ